MLLKAIKSSTLRKFGRNDMTRQYYQKFQRLINIDKMMRVSFINYNIEVAVKSAIKESYKKKLSKLS